MHRVELWYYKSVYTIWSHPENEARLKDAVAASISLAGALKLLGLLPRGSNYATLKMHIDRLQLNTDHFLGQRWNSISITTPKNARRQRTIRRYLIYTRGHRCESCLNSEWNQLPIPLEVEHIDGNSFNNIETNLLLLCCNCHAQTKTWRRRKSSLKPE